MGGIFDMLSVPKYSTIHNRSDLNLRYQPFLHSIKFKEHCKPFLTTFWLVHWHWILLEDPALPLEPSIIECLHNRLEDGFFIDFSGYFYSWRAKMNRMLVPLSIHPYKIAPKKTTSRHHQLFTSQISTQIFYLTSPPCTLSFLQKLMWQKS